MTPCEWDVMFLSVSWLATEDWAVKGKMLALALAGFIAVEGPLRPLKAQSGIKNGNVPR